MASDSGPRWPWLDRYASTSPRNQWQTLQRNGKEFYHRPLGLVESLFDADGRLFEGRADMNALLTLEMRSKLTSAQLRQRILDAWTRLRVEHALLRATAVHAKDFMLDGKYGENSRHFVIEQPQSVAQVQAEAAETITFLDDYYKTVDAVDFYRHAQNTARLINPSQALGRLLVFPIEPSISRKDTYTLRFVFALAHQVADGMTFNHWTGQLIILLNNSNLNDSIQELISPNAIKNLLPLAQETVYPPIPGSRARQRWFWAITIILRHVHRPLPAAIPNALRFQNPRPSGAARSPPTTYSRILDYSPARVPPLNTYNAVAHLSPTATRQHHRLCRSAGVSIGAGSFALAALVMHELEERRNPHIPFSQRLPLVASFPLDPRAMAAYAGPPDSLMLAFSSGITLPFLPSHLPLSGRFRLLARRAHAQLREFQKRPYAAKPGATQRDPLRLLANNYLMCIERCAAVLEHEGWPQYAPQGEYPVQPNPTLATHGISSVGSFRWPCVEGGHALDGTQDFAADFREVRQAVRVRDDEFLVAVGGDDKGLWTGVSFDGNAIDEEMVVEWRERMKTCLEEDEGTARL